MSPFEPNNCTRCGAAFRCGPAEGESHCWCDALPHVGPFPGTPVGCLCLACLDAAVTAHGGDSSSQKTLP